MSSIRILICYHTVRTTMILAFMIALLARIVTAAAVLPVDNRPVDGELNCTSRNPKTLVQQEAKLTAAPLVIIKQNFDALAWPGVTLKLDCRTDKGLVLPQTLIGPNGIYKIVPDIRSDPTQCWSCAVRWEAENSWNNIWVYSHGACEMPFVCEQCLWNIDQSGFSLLSEQDGFVHIWPWNKPIPTPPSHSTGMDC